MSSPLPASCAQESVEIPSVPATDERARAAARARLDRLTKPLGALGRLEDVVAQLASIQGCDRPTLRSPQIVVFAGDHGAAALGVSAYPREVTAQMVANYLAGGAAINVLARLSGLGLLIVDAGVDADLPVRAGLRDRKIRRGTRDYTREPALTAAEVAAALSAGRALAREMVDAGAELLIPGEMGIGNTGSAALLMHGLSGRSLELCVGRGTGLDDAGLARKTAILRAARDRAPTVSSPLALLAEFGGLEIAMMVGFVIEAAARRTAILVDGFTVTVAVALAGALAPRVGEYCLYGHRSAEQAHRALLHSLDAEPLLDLGMRLGEGTGGALAYRTVEAALALYDGMATFEGAGVSGRAP